MQISFVMLIFPLFSDQISGGQSVRGGQTESGGRPLPPVEEIQGTVSSDSQESPGVKRFVELDVEKKARGVCFVFILFMERGIH